MLRLSEEQYFEATEAMAAALKTCEDNGLTTNLGRASVMLDALGIVVDIDGLDPGPEEPAISWRDYVKGSRDDIESGEVWAPECEHCFSPEHTTEMHDTVLLERILAETKAHNKGLGAS